MDWLPSCESKSLPDSMEDVMDVTRTQDVSKYHQIDRTQSSKRTNERTNEREFYLQLPHYQLWARFCMCMAVAARVATASCSIRERIPRD